MLISLIVPIYNEHSGLVQFWQSLEKSVAPCDTEFEAVLIDDGSTDSTWEAIETLSSSSQIPIKAIRLSRNFGKEAAILAGLRGAAGQAAIVMDADLQHPPPLIPQMIDLWDNGKVKLVEAVKRKRQDESYLRRFGARLYYQTFNLSSGMNMDGASDFKLLDRSVIDQYISLPEVGRFFRGLTTWLGFDAVAIEFDPPARNAGESHWGLGRLMGLARSTIISFSSVPLRIVTWLGAIGVLFSIGLTLQTLWYQWQGYAEAGFPTVILLILAMGSMILLGLGLIGEYIGEIYREVKRRPAYVIAQSLSPEDSQKQRSSE
ncbi:MAG: glycosyltransferase family 2 protein [Candidatus Thiodiazotropha sp. 6PLUC2]